MGHNKRWRAKLALAFVFALSGASQAHGAMGMGCGTMCMSMGGGAMFSPFYGTPFYPSFASPWAAQTGQMGFYGPYSMYPGMDLTPLYVSNAYNWNGAQQMGYSYLPPMGMSAIGNSLSFGRMF